MIYYDIHTHKKSTTTGEASDVVSIYNLTQEEVAEGINITKEKSFFSCGIHPWNASDTIIGIRDLKHFVDNNRKVVAIGEVGLDKLTKASFTEQEAIFMQQIELALALDLPMIIHCVRAWDDLLRLYRKYTPSKPWIIHGFRGGREQAVQLAKFGFYFSFGEFHNAQTLLAIPPKQIFIETDESHVSIQEIYSKIASILNSDIEHLGRQIEQNVRRVFNL